MHAVIIGATGGIGSAFVDALATRPDVTRVDALARTARAHASSKVVPHTLDLLDEASIIDAAKTVQAAGAPDLILLATGILSEGDDLQPERGAKYQSFEAFQRIFAINTFGPALVAKHFLPLLPRNGRTVFGALSARVGSISDNRRGGWHAYRASKAALNMLIRNYAIEQSRRNEDAIIVSLHPGTVDTTLSKPFQRGVPDKQLFTAAQSAAYLLDVVQSLTPADTGKAFDWAGKEIPA